MRSTDMNGKNKEFSSTQPLTYLALGDSYTIGEGVAAPERYPNLTVKKLLSAGVHVQAPKIIAKTGWTTGELLNAMNEERIWEQRFGLVSLLIGVNNQYRGLSLEEYEKEFDHLVHTAVEINGNCPGQVYVLAIPDWGVTPFAKNDNRTSSTINREIMRFNRVNLKISKKHHTQYVDISPIYSLWGHLPENLVADQLHPSGHMYGLWADQLYPTILNSLDLK